MSLWRKFTYLLPWVRRAEDRDIQEELESLTQIRKRCRIDVYPKACPRFRILHLRRPSTSAM